MKGCVVFRSISVLCLTLCLVHVTRAQSNTDRNERLRESIQKFLGRLDEESRKTQYSAAFVDLRDDGAKEAIVYLSSDGWCGTGGCTMLVLAPEGTDYRVVTKTTVTRLPIRVLATKAHGWYDIGVGVGGGGRPSYEARLRFDGKSYPSNPSVSPAQRLRGTSRGKVVISQTTADESLYP